MKFKKTMLSISAALAGGTGMVIPAAMAISCGDSAGIVLVLDTPTSVSADKGFNQSIFDGIKDYSKSDPKIYKPSTGDVTGILASYATVPNGSLLVAAGAPHADALAASTKGEINGKNVLLVDAPLPAGASEEVKARVLALDFNIKVLAYVTGFALAKYLNGNYATLSSSFEVADGNEIKISTFGGMSILPVNAQMAGFKAGVKDYVATLTPSTKHVDWTELSTDAEHFSGTFAPGGGTEVSNKLITTAGADVILPVAGPQITDTIAAFKTLGKKGKVVGSDVAQEDIYNVGVPTDERPVLFSMIKNLAHAVSAALSNIYAPHQAGDVVFGQTLTDDLYDQGAQSGWVLRNPTFMDISETTNSVIRLHDEFVAVRGELTTTAVKAEAVVPQFHVGHP